MILTNSPYYLTIPWLSPSSGTTPDKYILELYSWTGLKASVPSTPLYKIENKNPLSRLGNSEVNISNYINDVLTIALTKNTTTSVIDGSSSVWVKTQVIYYIGGVAQSPEFVSTDLAIRGYGYGIEGKNTGIPSNNVLSSSSIVNVSKTSQFNLAFKVSESVATNITIFSWPDNEIDYAITIPATTNSNELIKKAYVKCSEALTDTYIEIKKDTVLVHTLNIKEELRYDPIDVWFINKFGQLYTMTFFKELITSLKVKSENYESSNGQPIDGVHQNVIYNKFGNTEFKAKTGFISEENNELIKQLLLSDKVWILQGDLFNPVNVTSSSVEYKSRQKDRLLDYEINFDYAYSEINDI